MGNLTAVEKWFADTVGIHPAAIGRTGFERIVATAMTRSDIADAEGLLERLSTSQETFEWCLEELVVPETWFFRDKEPFVLLEQHVREKRFSLPPDDPLRILSAPCSTGEEPYSIAITLLEAGIPPHRFRLDAADISRKALAAAERAVFGRGSFRQPLTVAQKAFFTATPKGRQVVEDVARTVHFHHDNLVSPGFLVGHAPYHVIFCRNILIYLTDAARRQVLANIDRLLAPGGLLFTGHAEMGFLQQQGFTAIRHARAFACQRTEQAPTPAVAPSLPRLRRPGIPPAAPPRKRRTSAIALPSPAPSIEEIPAVRIDKLHAEALALADRGLFDEAASLCRQYLQEKHPHADVYCLLGLIHEAARRPEEAEACYLKALYLDPDHYETLIQASLLYQQQGNDRQATLYRRRAETRERRPDGTARS